MQPVHTSSTLYLLHHQMAALGADAAPFLAINVGATVTAGPGVCERVWV